MPHVRQASYQIELFATTGARVAIFTAWSSLEIRRRLNDIDEHVLVLDGNDDRIPLFTLDSLVVVQRRVEHTAWAVEYIGFHRTGQWSFSEGGKSLFTSYGRGLVDLLHRREILYPSEAGLPQVVKSGDADDVMKAIVRENVGSGANHAARKNNGVTTGFSVQADAGAGPTWQGQRTWKNVLDVLQEIALASGVDFDVVLTSAWGATPAFEFRTYYPQRGTDRSATVKFSLNFGNMIEPTYSISRMEEANTVVVLGPGEGSLRRTVVRVDATAVAASPWNEIEVTHDARNAEKLAALNQAGDEKLSELRAKKQFSLKVLQIGDLLYGKDYFIGDKVTAEYTGVITEVKKITEININYGEEQEEQVDIIFADDVVT